MCFFSSEIYSWWTNTQKPSSVTLKKLTNTTSLLWTTITNLRDFLRRMCYYYLSELSLNIQPALIQKDKLSPNFWLRIVHIIKLRKLQETSVDFALQNIEVSFICSFNLTNILSHSILLEISKINAPSPRRYNRFTNKNYGDKNFFNDLTKVRTWPRTLHAYTYTGVLITITQFALIENNHINVRRVECNKINMFHINVFFIHPYVYISIYFMHFFDLLLNLFNICSLCSIFAHSYEYIPTYATDTIFKRRRNTPSFLVAYATYVTRLQYDKSAYSYKSIPLTFGITAVSIHPWNFTKLFSISRRIFVIGIVPEHRGTSNF